MSTYEWSHQTPLRAGLWAARMAIYPVVGYGGWIMAEVGQRTNHPVVAGIGFGATILGFTGLACELPSDDTTDTATQPEALSLPTKQAEA